MLENEKEILEHNYYLNKRKDARVKKRFIAMKHRFFLLGVFIGFLILVFLYLQSDESKIFKVVVSNNYYLSDQEIIQLSQLDDQDYYLFFSKSKVKKNLKENLIIQDVQIEKKAHRYIELIVQEEKIVANTTINQVNHLVLANGELIEYPELMINIPYLEGFTADQIKTLMIGFEELSVDDINEISEIHRYPFSYDENMMQVIMRDGNYVFVSNYGLKMLNQYHAILSGLNNPKHSCIYLDEVTHSGYLSKCPWQENRSEESDEE